MSDKLKTKYVALKVDGLKAWLWFKCDAVIEADGRVVAKAGWGEGGAYSELNVPVAMVLARLYSDPLAY